MRDTPSEASRKLRSRAHPAISLSESIELLRRLKLEVGWGERDRDTLAKGLGYAGGHSGIAARKAAALVHFGLMDLRGGMYSPTILAGEILEERTEALLREACLNPTLFREIVHRYEPAGRVPRQLALTLSLDHGIQEHARNEVAQIFMTSAIYAGILESDGTFRSKYFEETRRPLPLSGPLPEPDLSPREPESGFVAAAPGAGRTLRFPLTDQKEVTIHLPSRLNEHDIPLLRAQIDFLELQVKQNRPDQPVRLDVYRSDRKR